MKDNTDYISYDEYKEELAAIQGGEHTMKEHAQQLNHLSEVLYNESRDLDTISKGKAQLYQDIINEMQEHLDSIMNKILIQEGSR